MIKNCTSAWASLETLSFARVHSAETRVEPHPSRMQDSTGRSGGTSESRDSRTEGCGGTSGVHARTAETEPRNCPTIIVPRPPPWLSAWGLFKPFSFRWFYHGRRMLWRTRCGLNICVNRTKVNLFIVIQILFRRFTWMSWWFNTW